MVCVWGGGFNEGIQPGGVRVRISHGQLEITGSVVTPIPIDQDRVLPKRRHKSAEWAGVNRR